MCPQIGRVWRTERKCPSFRSFWSKHWSLRSVSHTQTRAACSPAYSCPSPASGNWAWSTDACSSLSRDRWTFHTTSTQKHLTWFPERSTQLWPNVCCCWSPWDGLWDVAFNRSGLRLLDSMQTHQYRSRCRCLFLQKIEIYTWRICSTWWWSEDIQWLLCLFCVDILDVCQ